MCFMEEFEKVKSKQWPRNTNDFFFSSIPNPNFHLAYLSPRLTMYSGPHFRTCVSLKSVSQCEAHWSGGKAAIVSLGKIG